MGEEIEILFDKVTRATKIRQNFLRKINERVFQRVVELKIRALIVNSAKRVGSETKE